MVLIEEEGRVSGVGYGNLEKGFWLGSGGFGVAGVRECEAGWDWYVE